MIKSFNEFITEKYNKFKEKQFQIILKTNPMHDSYHAGIETVDDILTYQEAASQKYPETSPDFDEKDIYNILKTNIITIYSSYDIKPGVFVTPSKMMAQDYAGKKQIHTKTVDITEVAWIDTIEGQYVGKL